MSIVTGEWSSPYNFSITEPVLENQENSEEELSESEPVDGSGS